LPHLISNIYFIFLKEIRDNIVAPVYKKIHTINPWWLTAFATVRHKYPWHGYVSFCYILMQTFSLKISGTVAAAPLRSLQTLCML
jgi:hypothetical protein